MSGPELGPAGLPGKSDPASKPLIAQSGRLSPRKNDHDNRELYCDRDRVGCCSLRAFDDLEQEAAISSFRGHESSTWRRAGAPGCEGIKPLLGWFRWRGLYGDRSGRDTRRNIRSRVAEMSIFALSCIITGFFGLLLGVLVIAFRERVLSFVRRRYKVVYQEDGVSEDDIDKRLPRMSVVVVIAIGFVAVSTGFVTIGLFVAT